ncbi:tRNA1(Val) A37 N6-methylase TrmN6 [Hydrogenivirga caldilitoris]|uniref:tRNA1(Val) A37 N6-methylase TrmN6 n=1 Tax=Hydrogenivirga caldilitoris TaxID=246264 RepID=A0A497XPF8_9AQUI|nr:methyltransferase [Hydrogenivirga caldilitoris]RLJ69999.1 tRNA1(Val) A37 N6-methylase TrmN6 [Hydrogenivirga caldilitoris]
MKWLKDSGREFSFFKGKLRLIQPEKHKLSVDLVLFLSLLKGIKRNSMVADLGAGFGFLSIAVAKKFGCKVWAIERNEEFLELLKKNVELNALEELITPVKGDIREIRELFRRGEFSCVITNPPFYPKEYGIEDKGVHFETDTTLRDFVKASSYLLRDGGYLNILIPSFRLYESFTYMREFNLPPRFMSVIYPTVEKGGKLCAVTSIRNVSGPLKIEKPVLINSKEGGYTQEVESLLEGYL